MRTVIAIIFLVGVCMFSILKVGSDSDDQSGLGDFKNVPSSEPSPDLPVSSSWPGPFDGDND